MESELLNLNESNSSKIHKVFRSLRFSRVLNNV